MIYCYIGLTCVYFLEFRYSCITYVMGFLWTVSKCSKCCRRKGSIDYWVTTALGFEQIKSQFFNTIFK